MKQLSIILLAGLLLASCSKETKKVEKKPNPFETVSAIEQHLIGTWKFEKAVDSLYTLEGQDQLVLDTVKDMTEDCQTDDVFTFRTDKTYSKDAGTMTSCGQSKDNISWYILAEDQFNFEDGPAYLTNNSYIYIDANHFGAQTGLPWASTTYIYKRQLISIIKPIK